MNAGDLVLYLSFLYLKSGMVHFTDESGKYQVNITWRRTGPWCSLCIQKLLPPASEGWGKVIFSVCLSVHVGVPRLWSQVPSQPLVPCLFWGGGATPSTGEPSPGPVQGYPLRDGLRCGRYASCGFPQEDFLVLGIDWGLMYKNSDCLPPALEGWGKVIFSVCVSVHGGEGGGGTYLPVNGRRGYVPSSLLGGGGYLPSLRSTFPGHGPCPE